MVADRRWSAVVKVLVLLEHNPVCLPPHARCVLCASMTFCETCAPLLPPFTNCTSSECFVSASQHGLVQADHWSARSGITRHGLARYNVSDQKPCVRDISATVASNRT